MKDKINLGVIGLGARGEGLLRLVYMQHPGVEFTAVCDRYQDRCEAAARLLTDKGRPAPLQTTEYKELLKMKELDAVIICTSWNQHVEL
ncbi:MAG: Gfo/Idh/MocA family protein, partial [Lachnospiraceae bacterium]